MRTKNIILFFIIIYLFVVFGCKREYVPPELDVDYNYLVVEGIILQSADSPSVFNLSRTRKLTDIILNSPERGAIVSAESNSGQLFQLNETGPGRYAGNFLVNPANTYRINIVTSNGENYISEFVEVKQTPPIDSLSFSQPGDLKIYVTTHDPANNTRYYRWDYVETSQYHAIGKTELGVNNGRIFFRDSTNQIYNCWHIANSTGINIASSLALSEDVISNYPLVTIPEDDPRVAMRYSILVKQYAISQAAYAYYQILQKNTEQQGSIFDQQPSQLKGNITSVDDPQKPVIGFVTASSVSQKRLFIRNDQLTNWERQQLAGRCDTVVLSINPLEYLNYTYPDKRYVPWYFTASGYIEVLAEIPCVDCRLQGGTNIKPSYW